MHGKYSELLQLELSTNQEVLFKEIEHPQDSADEARGRREIPLKISPKSMSPQEYGAVSLLSNASLFIPSSTISASGGNWNSSKIYLPIGFYEEPVGSLVIEIEDLEDNELQSLDEVMLIGSYFRSWLAMGVLSHQNNIQAIQFDYARLRSFHCTFLTYPQRFT